MEIKHEYISIERTIAEFDWMDIKACLMEALKSKGYSFDSGWDMSWQDNHDGNLIIKLIYEAEKGHP